MIQLLLINEIIHSCKPFLHCFILQFLSKIVWTIFWVVCWSIDLCAQFYNYLGQNLQNNNQNLQNMTTIYKIWQNMVKLWPNRLVRHLPPCTTTLNLCIKFGTVQLIISETACEHLSATWLNWTIYHYITYLSYVQLSGLSTTWLNWSMYHYIANLIHIPLYG